MICVLRLCLYLIAMLGPMLYLLAAPEDLIDTDFGTADRPVLGRGNQPNERVTGVLPGEWRDDSGWAQDVYATWTRLEEEGRAFLRLDFTRATDHWYQVAHALPDITEESFFRLNLLARSTQGVTIQVGLRDSGPPYSFHWQTSIHLGANWQEYSYDFRLTKIDRAVGLWITLSQLGQFDIATLKLVRLTRSEYIEELKRRYGEKGSGNLVRISRFPLGLQSGWALGRENSDGDDVQIAPDPDLIGPSGCPALKVATAEPTVLYTAPFGVPLAFQPHVASVYVRSDAEMRVAVLCEGRQIAQQSFAPEQTPGLRRVHVVFNPVLMARAYSLCLEGSQTFWIDALQVEPGKEPTPYRPAAACEVSLACPASDASMMRVQFIDEPATVEYVVTGKAQNAHLCVKVVNTYGEEKTLQPIEIDELPGRGIIRYDVLPQRPLGPFRIEAWVENTEGAVISTYNELVVYRLPRPRYWGKDAPESPFGVHTNSTTRHNLLAKAVGANWTRLHDAGLQYLGWYHLEREKGKWTFYDKEIKRYRRDHVLVLGELGTAPEWASYYPGKPHSSYFDRFYQPRRMEDYANYVRTVAQRYRGIITAYDIWNEPWIHAWWGVGYDESKPDQAGYITSEEPQKDFVRLMKTAFEAAKAVDPDITVLGVNSTSSGPGSNNLGGAEWTRGVVEAGGLDFCDAVCYHQYIGGKPGYAGDVVERGYQTAIGPILERFGRLPKPVWMTEGSAGQDTVGPGFYNHTLPCPNKEDVAETGDRLCRYVVALLGEGIARLFLYSMHAQASLDSAPRWSVLVTPEGYMHPSGAALAILTWHLEDTKFVERREVAEGVFAYLFEAKDGSRSVAALSGKTGHAPYILPRGDGLQVIDLFGNPVEGGRPLGETLVYVTALSPASHLGPMLR